MNSEPLDVIPLWCFFLLTMFIGMLSVELGYRIGKSRHAHSPDEKDAPVAAMVASILGLLSRIPVTIWIALFSLNVLGMASVGYQAGLTATRRSPEMLILTLAFASVLYLNVDLDRAHEGLLHVNQQPMKDLYHTMQATQP